MDDVFDNPLTARVRSALGDRAAREVPMFGGVSFMVDDHILVAARKAGDLLVRIDPGRRDEVLDLPGVGPARMPGGRPMGRQWVTVDADQLVTAAQLNRWLDTALDHGSAEQSRDRPTTGAQ